MSGLDYARADTLDVALFMNENPLASGPEGIEPVLAAIDEHAAGLAPDRIAGKSLTNYSRAAVKRLIARQQGSKIVLDLLRRADPETLYTMSFVRSGPVGFWLRIVIPFDYFEEAGRAEQRSRDLVSLVRALCEVCRPAYGYAHSKGDLMSGSDPHTGDPFAPAEVYEVYWLNVYGAEMVERKGRERVLSTPAAHLEELPGGGILLLTRPTPVDYASEEARSAQAQALAHLRDDVSSEEALARLRERSAKLAHVTRDWEPDIADLLELTLDSVSYSERQQETARLNAYRPPEVTEWRPLAELLPSDAEDPAAEAARYSDLYAEQLAALLRKDVPAVMEGGPDSLPRIDYHFWRFDYPGTFPREDIESDLVRAVGAYLGEVMVNHLGGRWVSRRNVDESQVVVGERAWLPFLRARRYLHSKESALDYSLTQFYRAAARAAGPDAAS
ncbi:MAG: hypothetical protein ABW208_24715 [Pyrinomonadaceae bacterium]